MKRAFQLLRGGLALEERSWARIDAGSHNYAMGERVLVAMSGGVDSSVAAWLLREQGYEVVGVFMRHGASQPVACAPGGMTQRSARRQGCCSAADAHDARRVADHLGIAFYALDFEQDFRRIMDYFVDEYRAGRTPNPCVFCNHWIKFGTLWRYAEAVGARYVATGHYARLEHAPDDPLGPYRLLRGRDRAKDQSYVLFGLPRDRLDRILFPVGWFTKAEIRDKARQLGLRVADKPDSQEICFVPDNDHFAFIQRYRPDSSTAGEIVDVERGVVGQHDGYERFTIGQRKGLNVALGSRRYVLRIEPETRRVIIGPKALLYRREMEVDQVNWLVRPPSGPTRCTVQIRYNHRPAEAVVTPVDTATVAVRFDAPQAAITPGQAAVFYSGDRVLGGGVIRAVRDEDGDR